MGDFVLSGVVAVEDGFGSYAAMGAASAEPAISATTTRTVSLARVRMSDPPHSLEPSTADGYLTAVTSPEPFTQNPPPWNSCSSAPYGPRSKSADSGSRSPPSVVT